MIPARYTQGAPHPAEPGNTIAKAPRQLSRFVDCGQMLVPSKCDDSIEVKI